MLPTEPSLCSILDQSSYDCTDHSPISHTERSLVTFPYKPRHDTAEQNPLRHPLSETSPGAVSLSLIATFAPAADHERDLRGTSMAVRA